MADKIRFVFQLPVRKVEKRKHVGRVTRDEVEEDVTYSWVVVLEHVGFAFEEEPPFKVGDMCRLIIEKEQ